MRPLSILTQGILLRRFFAADAAAVFVHGDEGGQHFPPGTSVPCLSRMIAVVVHVAVLLTVGQLLLCSYAVCQNSPGQFQEELRLHRDMV